MTVIRDSRQKFFVASGELIPDTINAFMEETYALREGFRLAQYSFNKTVFFNLMANETMPH